MDDIPPTPALSLDTLRIDQPMLRAIAELDGFNGGWAAAGRLAPDRLRALRHVATIESIGSSTRIEGSRLSDDEVESLLAGLDTESFASRDEQEVAGYAAVMDTVFSGYDAIALTENHIRQLHRDLLAFSDKDHRHRGAYKTGPNSVEAYDSQGKSLGVVFETASAFDTPRLMSELVGWTDHELDRGEYHPLLVIAAFVVVFLEIHPFRDGNGRLSRVLTTLLLLRAGYAYVPFSSLESVVEQNKEAYYLALRRTQRTIRTHTPDWQPWVGFFLESLRGQKRRLEAKLERERVVLASMPALSLKILEFVRKEGQASVAELVEATGKSRNTLKGHLRRLVAAGHLQLHGTGRGAFYRLG